MPPTAPTADPLGPLRADPATALVATDFDGSLSAIVDDPSSARPLPGAAALLDELAARYATVAVISGRPVDFLAPLLPSTVEVHGLYGLEVLRGGVRDDPPDAAAWRDAIGDVAASARAALPAEVLVEHKGLSLTLHYRRRPALADEVAAFAGAQAARSGLHLRGGRMAVELHPPVAIDKGTVLATLADGLAAACFVGDDEGDLPAFDALDRLATGGLATVRVAVRSGESPPELLARADVVVDGPQGAVELLSTL